MQTSLSASMRVIALVLAASVLLLAGATSVQAADSRWAVVDIVVPGQGTERALYANAVQPRLTAILLTGSDGVLTFDTDGNPSPGGNFLVRTRDLWAQQGFAIILLGSPGDASLLGRRHLPNYARALDSALDYVRTRSSAPVWLIGTSEGTIGAVNGGAHLHSKVAGVVLTSSITRQGASGETVFDADPRSIAVATLVVGNNRDTCHESPPGDMPRLFAALTAAPRKEMMVMQSSDIRSGPVRRQIAPWVFGDRRSGGAASCRLDAASSAYPRKHHRQWIRVNLARKSVGRAVVGQVLRCRNGC